jgi:hypothetical protein
VKGFAPDDHGVDGALLDGRTLRRSTSSGATVDGVVQGRHQFAACMRRGWIMATTWAPPPVCAKAAASGRSTARATTGGPFDK